MPIIYKTVKAALNAVQYGIGIASGDVGLKDGMSDFFGQVVSHAIGAGVNQLNSSEELYWTPYAEVPGVGDVYSLPSIVVNGNTMYNFYQGPSLTDGKADTGGYPSYVARSFGTAAPDQLPQWSVPGAPVPDGSNMFPSPPTGVVFNDKVYVFYGGLPSSQQTGQIWYTTYDGTSWSSLTLLPDVLVLVIGANLSGVAPVVFTPPGSDTPQLYVFYPMLVPGENTFDIGCVTTTDGETWSSIAPDGIGACVPGYVNEGVIEGPSMQPSVVVYPPTGDTAQIYVFYVSGSDGECSYITCSGADDGFSAPVAIPGLADEQSQCIAAAVSGDSTPLLYVYALRASPNYAVYTPPADSEANPVTYMPYEVWYSTFDGSNWSDPAQLQQPIINNSLPNVLSAATFSPDAFGGAMESTTDVYLSTVSTNIPGAITLGLCNSTAFVGGITQYASGGQPSAVLPPPAFPTGGFQWGGSGIFAAFLLEVDLPGFAAPQAWALCQTFNCPSSGSWSCQLQYFVYESGAWKAYDLPAMATDDDLTAPPPPPPQLLGSPAVLPVPQPQPAVGVMFVAYNSPLGIIAFNTLNPAAFSLGDLDGDPVAPVPGVTAIGSPALALFNEQVYLFYQGEDGGLYCTQTPQAPLDGLNGCITQWTAPARVGNASLTGSPSAVVFNGELYVFYQGTGAQAGVLCYASFSSATGAWSTPTSIIDAAVGSSILISGSPSACVCTDQAGNSQLVVAYGGPGDSSGYPLTACTLQSDGTWLQTAASGITLIDSPSAYSVQGAYTARGNWKLNVFFQSPSEPGQLLYCVYDGVTWSPLGTLPVTTLDGWVAPVMNVQQNLDGTYLSWLYLYHNNTGANASAFTYCQCTLPDKQQGQLVSVQAQDSNGDAVPIMTGRPAATIANGNIYMFYNCNAVSTTPFTTDPPGALCYLQLTLPSAASQQLALPMATTQTAVGPAGPDAIFNGTNFLAMANSPAAVTFQGVPYVFYNTGQGTIAGCAGLEAAPQTAASSVAASCSPAVVVGTSTTPVVNADDDNSVDVLYLFYVGSSTTQVSQDGKSYEAGKLLCRYTTDGVSWFDLDLSPAPSVNSEGVLATLVNGQLYLFYANCADSYYTIFPGLDVVTGEGASVTLPAPTQISRMACSTGPSVTTFNNNIWCLTQGVVQSSYTFKNGWNIEQSGNLFFSRTLDATCWSWNTAINQQAGAPPMSGVRPAAASFTPSSGTELLYVFWPAASGGFINYLTTDGTVVTPSSTAYGMPWASPNQVGSDAYTNDNVAAVVMPPLDTPTGSDQLYVFWQGSNHSGYLYYASMNPSGAWTAPTQIKPAGTQGAYMSLSPSVVTYAPGSGTPQPYVFYQSAGSSGTKGDYTGLYYCVYANGAWTQAEVPNITYTPQAVMGVPQQTYNGIDAGTPPAAIVYDGKLYVFYIQPTYQWSETKTWSTLYPVTYSVFDGTTWSGPNRIGVTSTVNQNTKPFSFSQVPQFVSAAILNGQLYVYFMNAGAIDASCPPPGVVYYVSFNGTTWSNPTPTTNVVYVPGGTTTLSNNLGTEINDAATAINDALQYVGLPTMSDLRQAIESKAVSAIADAFF
ncbi:hypothetical protein JY651_17470 [Pyxidicoccus parkwayensis]|uniref:Exo-alpha-sialidase n=1 Tax=Pyxidicoccus parkwayensis TaxID=2813578 RepID=A0ABX7P843_9BACT|nr:hypothetical protein [Pyxidicoccus parkwaysis]QSQ26609.1 hypothetical protein JY651_17470 [Pyxidicoccus parkwaysis]